MIFTKDKIEEIKKHKSLKVLNYNEELLLSLFKDLNSKFSKLNDFLTNLENEGFVLSNNKAQVKKENVYYVLKENNNEIDTDLLLREESDFEKSLKQKRSIETILRNNKSKRSDYLLDCDDFINIYFLNNKITFNFKNNYKSKIKKIFEESEPQNQINKNNKDRVCTVDFLRMPKIFEFLLRKEMYPVIEKNLESITNVSKEIGNLINIKKIMIKSIKTEQRKEVNDIFLNFSFIYSKKDKKEKLKEIQDIMLLQLDLIKPINLKHVDRKKTIKQV